MQPEIEGGICERCNRWRIEAVLITTLDDGRVCLDCVREVNLTDDYFEPEEDEPDGYGEYDW